MHTYRNTKAMLSIVGGAILLAMVVIALKTAAPPSRAAPAENAGATRPPAQLAATSGVTASRPLRMGILEEPTLDFHVFANASSFTVLSQLMEGLLTYGPDGSLESAGAVTYTVSADAKMYTVTLRNDARWSDGQVVTAQHYVDGMVRMLDPDVGNQPRDFFEWLLDPVVGAVEYSEGTTTTPPAGITAVGPYTLQFTLKEPAAYFPAVLATGVTYPARMDLIDGDPDWTEVGHLVGNGPYSLTTWTHGDLLVVHKNTNYHSAGQVTIEEIRFSILSTAEQLAAYENDLLDVGAIPPDELTRVLSDPVLKEEFERVEQKAVFYIGLNTQLTPTNNVSVCQALAAAVDRNALLTDVLHMPWREPATSVIPPGIAGYQNGEVGFTFNPTQAQTLLAQAGYTGGVGMPAVQLWGNSDRYGAPDLVSQMIVTTVAKHWRDNLGISVTTVLTHWFPEYLQDTLWSCQTDPGACDYHGYRLQWYMDYGDPKNLLTDLFHPDSANQYTGWDSARYREVTGLALTETNQMSRTTYYQEADQILVEEQAAVIPLFYPDEQLLIKSDLLFWYSPLLWGQAYVADWRFTTVQTVTVDAATGGTVRSPDGDIIVEVPADAVSDTVAVTYTAFYLPSHPPTATFAYASNAFEIEMVDLGSGQAITTPTKPLTLTIDYTDGDLGGQAEDSLELRYWDGTSWSTDGITVVERDTANNRLVVQISHLTEFALFGQHRIYLPLVLRN